MHISDDVSTVMENKWRLVHSLLKCLLFLLPFFFSGFVYPLELYYLEEAFYKQSSLFTLMSPLKMLQIAK